MLVKAAGWELGSLVTAMLVKRAVGILRIVAGDGQGTGAGGIAGFHHRGARTGRQPILNVALDRARSAERASQKQEHIIQGQSSTGAGEGRLPAVPVNGQA